MGWDGRKWNPGDTREGHIREDYPGLKALERGPVAPLAGAPEGVFYGAYGGDDGITFGAVFLTELTDGYLMIKAMDEMMGPFNYDCPESILALLSDPEKLPYGQDNAAEWRAECRARAVGKGAMR